MTPEDKIRAYLFANKSKIEFSTLNIVVSDVKLNVFYGMSPISDDEIRAIVTRWASIHAIGLVVGAPAGGTAPPAGPTAKNSSPSDSELVTTVKKAIATITEGVTVGRKGANVNLGVTGLTANLAKGSNLASFGITWTGTLKLNAQSGPVHFTGSLSKDSWELVLSFPKDSYIPDMSKLGKVFSEGERAMVEMAKATRSFKNIDDARRIGALIKPHADAASEAVEALGGIMNAEKKGGASFGFRIGSPQPGPGEQGMPGGVQGTIVFTYVF